MYRINNWINEGSGWIAELISFQYINFSTYRPLTGRSYIKLPAELKSLKTGLINIKNNDQKCFLWCHVSHINPVKTHPERVTQKYRKIANSHDYDGVGLPVQEKDFSKIGTKNSICILSFVTKIDWFFQSTFQIKNLKN